MGFDIISNLQRTLNPYKHFECAFSEGSACQLHTGERGICKNAQKCNWLIHNLKDKRIKFDDIRRCSFSVSKYYANTKYLSTKWGT